MTDKDQIVVIYYQEDGPVTLPATPEDLVHGRRLARMIDSLFSSFKRKGGKQVGESVLLGRVTFWEERTRGLDKTKVVHTYHMAWDGMDLDFNSAAWEDMRRWLVIAGQLLGLGYPGVITSWKGNAVQFRAADGRAIVGLV